MTVAPVELRDLACALAHEGAGLAREMRREGIDVADTKTSAVDVMIRRMLMHPPGCR